MACQKEGEGNANTVMIAGGQIQRNAFTPKVQDFDDGGAELQKQKRTTSLFLLRSGRGCERAV
jgi:hypothetical protein